VDVIADIEQALFAHWSVFGRWAKGRLHDEGGLLWLQTPLRHLPHNGVIRTRLVDDAGVDAAIPAVLERIGRPCFWFDHPSATPPSGVTFEEVVDDAGLGVYTELTRRYWRIPETDRPLLAELQRELGPGRAPGHRYLAHTGGEAIGKGYLSLAGPPGVAAIFGMSVLPEARGRGVAAGLTATLQRRAREAGCHRVVLHSTEMAVGVYRRAGFAERCQLGFFER
jgi:GNAT superfamily N-acetyltransferase